MCGVGLPEFKFLYPSVLFDETSSNSYPNFTGYLKMRKETRRLRHPQAFSHGHRNPKPETGQK